MSTAETTKSRLPRTRTLVLIAVVLLIGGAMLSMWWPYHCNQSAMAEVEKHGGKTETVIIRPFWVPDVVHNDKLALFKKVKMISLNDTDVSDAELEHLTGLSNLEFLRLDNTQVGDEGLEYLGGLTKIQRLWLDNTQVGDAGVEQLRAMTQLEYLGLDNTHVGDAGLEHLRGLTNLQHLYLEETRVTETGINNLQNALPDCVIDWTPPLK